MNQNYALFAIPVLLILSVFFAIDPAFSELTIDVGNLLFSSGTAFFLEFDHAITQNRTVIFPDADITVVGTTNTQTLSGKTMDGDVNTFVDINESQMDVAVGASGLVLTSNGAGSPPTYQASAGGTTYHEYDFFIKTDENTYTAYDNKFTQVSDNADLDTVWNAVQSHANYTGNEHLYIQFGSGQFLTTDGIDINRSNVTLAGMGSATWLVADTTMATDVETISFGSGITSVQHNIVDADREDNVLTLDATGSGNATAFTSAVCSDPCIVVLQSDYRIGDTVTELRAEFHEVVEAYDANGTIKLMDSLLADFHTVGGASPQIRLADSMIHNVVLKDISIDDLRPSTLSIGAGSAHKSTVHAYWTNNFSAENVIINNGFRIGLEVRAGIDAKISNCHIEGMRGFADFQNHVHYGIRAGGLTLGMVIDGCSFNDSRHAVATFAGSRTTNDSGENRNLVISNNVAHANTSTCFDTHDGGYDVTIIGNACTGRSNSVTNDLTVEEAGGISVRTPSLVIGNTVTNIDYRCISITYPVEVLTTNLEPRDTIIAHNKCINTGEYGVYAQNATNLMLDSNMFINATLDCIYLESTNFPEPITATIRGNTIDECDSEGIRTDHRIIASDNKISNTGSHAILLYNTTATTNPSYSILKDNEMRFMGDDGVRSRGGNFITVDGNYVYQPADNCFLGSVVQYTDFSNSTFTNNTCENAGYPNYSSERFFYGEEVYGSVFMNNHAINVSEATNCAFMIIGDADDNLFFGNTARQLDGGCFFNVVSGNNTFVDNYEIDSGR